eukprot:jgi/Tetstr1/456627/TSEL_043330.t1
MWCAASRPPPASTGGDDTSGYCSWNACADAAPEWDNWCSQSRSNCEDRCEAGVWCAASRPPPASTGGDDTSGYCSWNACADAAPAWDNWCSQSRSNCEDSCEAGVWCASSGGQAPPSGPPPASTGGDDTSGYCSWNACADAAPAWDNWCSQSRSNCEDSCEAGMWCAASGEQAPPSDPPPASTGGDNTSGYCSWNACTDTAPEWDNWCSQSQWHCEHNCEHGAWCAASGGQAPPSDPPPASTGGDDTSGYCSWTACADTAPEWDNWCSQSRSNCEDRCEAGVWCAASRPPPASTGGDDTSGYCSWNACADAAPAWDNWCSQSRSNCEDSCEAGVWCSTPVAGLGRKRARSKMLLL